MLNISKVCCSLKPLSNFANIPPGDMLVAYETAHLTYHILNAYHPTVT